MARLLFDNGPQVRTYLDLKEDTTVIGRDAVCQVRLVSDEIDRRQAVSRRHAVIRRLQGQYFLEDGNGEGRRSRNCTYLNGQRVTTRTPLRDNDRITICDFKLTFYEVAGSEPLSGATTLTP